MANGYLQVPHALLRSGTDPILLRVYLVIASFADAGTRDECTAARETIAAASGCSVAAVKRSVTTLKSRGWIAVEERSGKPSVIRPQRPRDVDLPTGQSDTYPGHTDPGVGHTDPTPGSHRPTKKTERRRQREEDEYLKTNAGGIRRVMSDAQLSFLMDLVLLLEHDEPDPEGWVRRNVTTYDEADEMIQDLWQQIEHTGRDDIAYQARREPVVYSRLSPRGRAFVDQEDLTA